MARLVLENNKIYEEYVKKTIEERAYLKAELDEREWHRGIRV